MEKFDYLGALKKLEETAVKVEDPATDIESIDRYIKESDELIAECRRYLRSVRDQTDGLNK